MWSGEPPVTPRQRRMRLRKQRVRLPEKPQSTPIHDYLRGQQRSLPGCTSVELEVSRALVNNRSVGESILLPLSNEEQAAAAAASGVVQDDAVTRERREKWLADPAVRRKVDAYLSFVTAKCNDISFTGFAPQHISLSLNLAWLKIRKLAPLYVRDKALTRGASWWEPGLDSSGASERGDQSGVIVEGTDDAERREMPPGLPPRPKEPAFCHDCRIVPAEREFPRESTAVLAVALCMHCVGLREKERLETITAETKRLIDELDFDPHEAQEQAQKKFPPRKHPGEGIEVAQPTPDNPRAAAAKRLAAERERAAAAEKAAQAAVAAASEVRSVEAVNLANNELVSCAGLTNSIRPFLFYSKCECLLLLDLSHNKIEDLGDAFESFTNLQMLYLQNNKLDSMERVAPLAALRRLEKLALRGNPLELRARRKGTGIIHVKRHDYRTRVIALLPWLKQLDATTVTADEGFTARKTSSYAHTSNADIRSMSSLSELSSASASAGIEEGRSRRSLSPTRRLWGTAC